jgi:hypothetical protein
MFQPWAFVSDEQRGDMIIVVQDQFGHAASASRLYSGQFGCGFRRMPSQTAAVKLAVGRKEVKEMDNELDYYRNNLNTQQGESVAQFLDIIEGESTVSRLLVW